MWTRWGFRKNWTLSKDLSNVVFLLLGTATFFFCSQESRNTTTSWLCWNVLLNDKVAAQLNKQTNIIETATEIVEHHWNLSQHYKPVWLYSSAFKLILWRSIANWWTTIFLDFTPSAHRSCILLMKTRPLSSFNSRFLINILFYILLIFQICSFLKNPNDS